MYLGLKISPKCVYSPGDALQRDTSTVHSTLYSPRYRKLPSLVIFVKHTVSKLQGIKPRQFSHVCLVSPTKGLKRTFRWPVCKQTVVQNNFLKNWLLQWYKKIGLSLYYNQVTVIIRSSKSSYKDSPETHLYLVGLSCMSMLTKFKVSPDSTVSTNTMKHPTIVHRRSVSSIKSIGLKQHKFKHR